MGGSLECTVAVPPGVRAGETIEFAAPDGRSFTVAVPLDVVGDTFSVSLPPLDEAAFAMDVDG